MCDLSPLVVGDTVLVTRVAVRDIGLARRRNRPLLSHFLNYVIAGLGFLVGMSPPGISRAVFGGCGSIQGNCFFFINFPAEGNQTCR